MVELKLVLKEPRGSEQLCCMYYVVAYPVRGYEVGAVRFQPFGADVVGGGEVANAVADVDGGHEHLLALPHEVAQPHAARRPHQSQGEAVHVA